MGVLSCVRVTAVTGNVLRGRGKLNFRVDIFNTEFNRNPLADFVGEICDHFRTNTLSYMFI